jgi:SAM-dependent methyltransferase
MSSALRWVLLLPRGAYSPRRLLAILEPRPGDRILEIGPGVGLHAIPVAKAVEPGGEVDVIEIQPEMIADLRSRAAAAGVGNLSATCGDATRLPYGDQVFDAAFLNTVLGELPAADAAIRELRRVVKPDGRLVVGEIVVDPDFISLRELCCQLSRAGFVSDRKSRSSLAYLARFRCRNLQRDVPNVARASRSKAMVAGLGMLLFVLSCGAVVTDADRPRGVDGWLVGDTGTKLDTVAKHLRGNDVVMLEVELRHRELLAAIEAANWKYADYQLTKIELVMRLGGERRPARKPSYDLFFQAALSPMRQALETRDVPAATAAYDAMTAGCVTCHGMENVGFMPVFFRQTEQE